MPLPACLSSRRSPRGRPPASYFLEHFSSIFVDLDQHPAHDTLAVGEDDLGVPIDPVLAAERDVLLERRLAAFAAAGSTPFSIRSIQALARSGAHHTAFDIAAESGAMIGIIDTCTVT